MVKNLWPSQSDTDLCSMDTYPHAPHLSDSVTIDVFLCAQSPFALKSNRLLVAFTSPTQMTCGAKAILKAGAGGSL